MNKTIKLPTSEEVIDFLQYHKIDTNNVTASQFEALSFGNGLFGNNRTGTNYSRNGVMVEFEKAELESPIRKVLGLIATPTTTEKLRNGRFEITAYFENWTEC